MPEARKKLESGTTPRGLFRYPRLDSPDTKFNAAGVYKVDLVLPAELAQPLIKKIDTAMAASFADAKAENKGKKIKMSDAPYKAVTNDKDEETGEIKFSFKMTASGEYKTGAKKGEKWTARPQMFDAKAQPLKDVKVGGGTEGRVSYEIMPFYTALVGAGVSLRLKAVQILKLVEYGNKDAKSYGFDAEDDGYDGTSADESEAPERTDAEAEAATGAEGEKDF